MNENVQSIEKELLNQLNGLFKGGPASGNHGHRGRPGVVGGSGGGGKISMGLGVGNLSSRSYGALDYKGIKEVCFNNKGDKKEAIKNAKDIDSALSKVNPKYVKGLNALYVTDGGGFLGSATYIPVSNKPGYASDQIMLMGGWVAKNSISRQQSLLHEVGHRAQNVTDKDSFVAFQKEGLKKYFKDVTDPKFASNYKESHYDGETFAESFSRYNLGISQPKALNDFWKGRE